MKNFLFHLYFPLITSVIYTVHKCQKIYSPRFLLKLPLLFPWFYKASLCFLWWLIRSRTFCFKLRSINERFLFVEHFLATVPIRLSYLLQEETKWLLIAILWINRKYIYLCLRISQEGSLKENLNGKKNFSLRCPPKKGNNWHPISFLLLTFLFPCNDVFNEEISKHFGEAFIITVKYFTGSCSHHSQWISIPNPNFTSPICYFLKHSKKGTHCLLLG